MRFTRITAALALSAFASPAVACDVTAAPVLFGAYDTFATAPADSAGTVQVVCRGNSHEPVVEIGAGQSGNPMARQMSSGAYRLNYHLYTNASRSIVWGNGSQGTSAVPLPLVSNNRGLRTFRATVYGRIPAGQRVAEGTYGDVLLVTVTF